MRTFRSTLLASVALILVASPAAFAETVVPFQLAQAETGAQTGESVALTAIEQAEADVEAARAALRNAMAGNGNVRDARRELRRALQRLEDVRNGVAPEPTTEETETAETPDEIPAETAVTSPPETQVLPPLEGVQVVPPVEPVPLQPATPDQPQLVQPEVVVPPQPQLVQPEVVVPLEPQPQLVQPEIVVPPQPELAQPEVLPTQPLQPEVVVPPQPQLVQPEIVPPPPQVVQPEITPLPPQPEQQATDGPTSPDGPAVPPVVGENEELVQTEDDGRVIVEEEGQLQVRSDDTRRIEQEAGARREVEESDDGTTTTTITRRNGVQIVTVRAPDGSVLQRYRRQPNGQIDVLIGEAPDSGRGFFGLGRRNRDRGPERQDRPLAELLRSLPQFQVTIPREQYIVESDQATQQQLQEALVAPPVAPIRETYTLNEVRQSGQLRNFMPRIDVDTITFEFGSAQIPPDQVPRMQQIGNALSQVISRNPLEVYLVEGHTDAVGSDLSNIGLSDRRAESVAFVLSNFYGIPPENLVTQGYGEYYLKELTAGPSRINRRVTLRRITPLLRGPTALSAN